MFKNKLNYKLLNILIFAIIIYIVLLTSNYWMIVVSKIASIAIPFIIAFAIAYSFYPIVKKLRGKGLSNGLSVTIVAGSVIFVFTVLLIITVPLLYDQLIILSQSIASVISDIQTKFAVNLGDFSKTVDGILNGLIESLGQMVSNGAGQLLNNSIGFLSNTIIILILSIYFLADMEKIRREVKKLLMRDKKHKRLFSYVKTVDNQLVNYLLGLVLFMAIHFVEYSVLFLIIGHPNWLLLGMLAAVTTIIPYFGGLIANIIAVILASVVSLPLFIATLVICLIFPNIDGYVIQPKIFGKTNNMSAFATIFAVVAGGSLFGIPGIIIALPAYIILSTTFNFFKEDIYAKLEDIKDNNETK
jgi:predicted PurR-regulated permease PerM